MGVVADRASTPTCGRPLPICWSKRLDEEEPGPRTQSVGFPELVHGGLRSRRHRPSPLPRQSPMKHPASLSCSGPRFGIGFGGEASRCAPGLGSSPDSGVFGWIGVMRKSPRGWSRPKPATPARCFRREPVAGSGVFPPIQAINGKTRHARPNSGAQQKAGRRGRCSAKRGDTPKVQAPRRLENRWPSSMSEDGARERWAHTRRKGKPGARRRGS